MKAASPLALPILISLAALPAAALAHPKLLKTAPVANAAVSNVTKATLSFSETLIGPVSGVDLVMKGASPTKIAGVKTALGPGNKTLVATFAHPLAPGSYELDWHAVSTDTHRVKGSYSFTVR